MSAFRVKLTTTALRAARSRHRPEWLRSPCSDVAGLPATPSWSARCFDFKLIHGKAIDIRTLLPESVTTSAIADVRSRDPNLLKERARPMRKSRKIHALVFTTLGLIIAGSFGAAPAQAATGPWGSVITCKLAVHYPHNSGHVSGTINVSSDILCSGTVDAIYTTTGLRGKQSSNGWAQAFNTNYKDSNAAKPCVNGTYWGIGSGTITFPSGYTPHVANVEGTGIKRSVNCSTSGLAAASTQDDVVVYEVSAVRRG